MPNSILFVDDEANILRSLNRAFLDENYTLFFAQSAQEALDILENNVIDLIISDMRMPVMSGFELLRIVKEKYPHTIRIILSGYADESLVFKAIQTNIAKFYILKPWDNEFLKQLINNLFQLEDTINNKRYIEIINNIDYIPTLKDLYLKITNAIEKDLGIEEIVKYIEKDPAISSKLLQVANSAFYNLKTASIKQAAVYLGLINVKNIVLNTSIFESVQNSVSKTLLWQHANIANTIFYYVFENILKKKVNDTFASAGLLHGIGQLLLLKTFKEKYIAYIEYLKSIDQVVDYEALETDKFGMTHTKLGAALLHWWDIPLPVVEAALYHHKPYDDKIINKEVVCVANIACYCSWDILGIHCLDEYPLYSIKYLDIDDSICYQIKNWFLQQNNY